MLLEATHTDKLHITNVPNTCAVAPSLRHCEGQTFPRFEFVNEWSGQSAQESSQQKERDQRVREGSPPETSPFSSDGLLRGRGKIRSRVHRQGEGNALRGAAAQIADGEIGAHLAGFLSHDTCHGNSSWRQPTKPGACRSRAGVL